MAILQTSPPSGGRPRTAGASSAAHIEADDRQLQRLLRIGFVFFLIHTALSRLVWWRRSTEDKERRSLVAEARDAADTYIPLSFIGW